MSAIGASDAQVRADAADGAASILAATGRNPRYFRPPFGYFTDAALGIWNSLGLFAINWSIDSNDWRDPSNADAAFANIASSLNADPNSGHIVLCHDTHTACLDAFPRIVELFKDNGYSFVTLEQCLGVAPYQ